MNSTWLLGKADSTELGPIRDYKVVAYLNICGILHKPTKSQYLCHRV